MNLVAVTLEEWQLSPESSEPGWARVAGIVRAACMASDCLRLEVFVRDGGRRYVPREFLPTTWSEELEERVGRATFKDAFVAMVLKGTQVPEMVRQDYRCVRETRGALDALETELDAELSGLEEWVREDGILFLAGHDGEPIWTLSDPRRAES